MKVALVHDYLNQMGGAERVVLALHEMFPDAPIYTSIFDPQRVDPAFQKIDIRTSFMQHLPKVSLLDQKPCTSVIATLQCAGAGTMKNILNANI